MLIPAARPNATARQVSNTESIPSPTGGWNSRDNVADMEATDAIQLDNYIAGTSDVYLRMGSDRHAANVGQLTTFTRSTTATYMSRFSFTTSQGTLMTAAIDTPRYLTTPAVSSAPFGTSLIIEAAATNRVLQNRDVTNASWTKSNCTAARSTGIDATANSASRITATGSPARITQSITSTSRARVVSVYVRVVSGSGGYKLTLDNFSTSQNGVVASGLSYYVRLGSRQTLANPVIGLEFNDPSSVWDVDFFQEEDGDDPTSPIPTTTLAVTRAADVPGYTAGSDVSTVGGHIDTLISYASGTTTRLLAAAGGNIYNVTTSGPIGVPLSTGYTSDKWQYQNVNGYSLLFNGSDAPIKYDGTSITANAITGSGLTQANLNFPYLFKHRLFMIERNTMNAWYLSTDAISGAATKLDFSTYFSMGGYLVAIGSLTRDGGSGPDDLIVFMTNRGEVIVYQGTDPQSSTTWFLVGVFRIGAPIGTRPLLKYGPDVIAISEDGFIPVSQLLPADRLGAQKLAISDKIRKSVNNATTLYRNNFGWEGVYYPRSGLLLFNVPVVESTTSNQYVMNTLNKSWCRFTGWNANCFTVHDNNLYFAQGHGFVVKVDELTMSDTSTSTAFFNSIQGDIKPAFNYFASRSRKKQYKMMRPVIASNTGINISYSVCVDFEDKNPTTVSTPTVTGAAWDTSAWDTTAWSNEDVIRKNWLTVTGYGYCATVHLRTSTKGASISLKSIDWLFESGGVL